MSPKSPDPFEPKTNIAKRINEYFNGENFEEIAKKTLVTGRTVADVLKGNTKPSFKILEYIAENGGDVNYILTGKKAAPAVEAGAEILPITDVQKQALALSRQIVDMLLDIEKEMIKDAGLCAPYLDIMDEFLSGIKTNQKIG